MKGFLTVFALTLAMTTLCQANEGCSSTDRKQISNNFRLIKHVNSDDITMDMSYTKNIEIYDPSTGPTTIATTDKSTIALAIGDGFLGGSDHGEFGGELVYKDATSPAANILLYRNIIALYGSGTSAIAFFSYDHMLQSEGAIYLVNVKSENIEVCQLAFFDHRLDIITSISEDLVSFKSNSKKFTIDSRLKIIEVSED